MSGKITVPSFVAKAVRRTRRASRKSSSRKSAKTRVARKSPKRRNVRRTRRSTRKVNRYARYIKANASAFRKGQKATIVMKDLAKKWNRLSPSSKAKF